MGVRKSATIIRQGTDTTVLCVVPPRGLPFSLRRYNRKERHYSSRRGHPGVSPGGCYLPK